MSIVTLQKTVMELSLDHEFTAVVFHQVAPQRLAERLMRYAQDRGCDLDEASIIAMAFVVGARSGNDYIKKVMEASV